MKHERVGAAIAAAALLAAGCTGSSGGGGGGGEDVADVPNPIMFVTQVPIPADYLTVNSTFGNHLARPGSAGRGGDLFIRYPDGRLKNLTRIAGYGVDGLQVGPRAIAVREPSVHWNGQRAVFSMVVGGPAHNEQTTYFWQLYEVRGLRYGELPVITRVPFQPPNANNVSPCYGSDGRIIFASDRSRTGEAHLYPQLDEYELAPTVTGLWSLHPGTGDLALMNHSPSGSFSPMVDSFGRVLFTRWDHLERDQQVDIEEITGDDYGTFNYTDEGPFAAMTASNAEVFPEPRSQWINYVNQTPDTRGR
jgi:hypothetical protein